MVEMRKNQKKRGVKKHKKTQKTKRHKNHKYDNFKNFFVIELEKNTQRSKKIVEKPIEKISKKPMQNYVLGSHITDMQRLVEDSSDPSYEAINNFNSADENIVKYNKGKKEILEKWMSGDTREITAIKDNFIPTPYLATDSGKVLPKYKGVGDMSILLNEESFPYTFRHIVKAMLERWKIGEIKLKKTKKEIEDKMIKEGKKKMRDEDRALLLKSENPFPFVVDRQSIYMDFRLFVYYLVHLFEPNKAMTEYERISSILNLKKDGARGCSFIHAHLYLNNMVENSRFTIKKIYYTRQNVPFYTRRELEEIAKREDSNELKVAIKKASESFNVQNFEIPSCMFVMQGLEFNKLRFKEVFLKLNKMNEYEEIMKLAEENTAYSINHNKLKKNQEGKTLEYTTIHYFFQSTLPTNYPIAPLIYLTESYT